MFRTAGLLVHRSQLVCNYKVSTDGLSHPRVSKVNPIPIVPFTATQGLPVLTHVLSSQSYIVIVQTTHACFARFTVATPHTSSAPLQAQTTGASFVHVPINIMYTVCLLAGWQRQYS